MANLGFALRSTVFSAPETIAVTRLLDGKTAPFRVFIPDGRTGPEAMEIASSILGASKNLHVGSGVIRLLEHDANLLVRRIETLQAFSTNRFFLGIGTGSPGSEPGESVTRMLERLGQVKKMFHSFTRGIEPPQIFVAALKQGIARRAVYMANGLLFNFCSPNHAMRLIEQVKPEASEKTEYACYLKIFYSSRDNVTAKRLLVQEFLNYDSTSQYHEMFVQDGIADIIKQFAKDEKWKKQDFDLPDALLTISLANAVHDQLKDYVESYRKAGVMIPVVYPYFPQDEKSEFKMETMKDILHVLT